jgi:hypothetical protein
MPSTAEGVGEHGQGRRLAGRGPSRGLSIGRSANKGIQREIRQKLAKVERVGVPRRRETFNEPLKSAVPLQLGYRIFYLYTASTPKPEISRGL